MKKWEGHVQSIGDVVFLSHFKGKRRSAVLWFGKRTFLVCSLAFVIHGTGLRTHPPLAWNWVLQDEIERARISSLAAMCQLLGEGVRKRVPRASLASLASWSLQIRGGPWRAGGLALQVKSPGNRQNEMHCEDFSIQWPHPSTRRSCTTRGRRRASVRAPDTLISRPPLSS